MEDHRDDDCRAEDGIGKVEDLFEEHLQGCFLLFLLQTVAPVFEQALFCLGLGQPSQCAHGIASTSLFFQIQCAVRKPHHT